MCHGTNGLLPRLSRLSLFAALRGIEMTDDANVAALLRAWVAVVGPGRWVNAGELITAALDDRQELLLRAFEGLRWPLRPKLIGGRDPSWAWSSPVMP